MEENPKQTNSDRIAAPVPKVAPFLPVDEVLTRFIQQVSSLATSLPLLMSALVDSLTKQMDQIENFVKTHCTPGEEERSFLIPTALHGHYLELQRNLDRTVLAGSSVPESFLVSLVSQYDSFLGSLLRTLFYARPEILLGSERTLTFKELNEFNDIEDARDFIVEKEIESVIRKSHQEQFEWMENKFRGGEKDKFTLRKDLPSLPVFMELTERRNLFVHCDGVISSQYLKACTANKIDCSHLVIGEKLGSDPKYFRRAWESVFEIAVKLSHVLWRKVLPDQKEAADLNLITISYDLIVEKRYGLAINILEFGTEILKKHSSDYHRRVLVINKAQAHKWIGDTKKATEILAAEDWSSTADKFSLACMVLRDDFDAAASLMEKIGADSSPNEHSYQNWPIFKEFRKSPQFAKAYEKVFGRPFKGIEETLKMAASKTAVIEGRIGADVPTDAPEPAASENNNLSVV